MIVAAAFLAACVMVSLVVIGVAAEVHARQSPPLRHARWGSRPVSVGVFAVPLAPDAWPVDVADTIPTRPMVRPS